MEVWFKQFAFSIWCFLGKPAVPSQGCNHSKKTGSLKKHRFRQPKIRWPIAVARDPLSWRRFAFDPHGKLHEKKSRQGSKITTTHPITWWPFIEAWLGSLDFTLDASRMIVNIFPQWWISYSCHMATHFFCKFAHPLWRNGYFSSNLPFQLW